MFDWLLGDRRPRITCLGPCGKTLLSSQIVFVNHCYHPDERHWRCAGLRLLCTPCHKAIGTYDYYAAFVPAKLGGAEVSKALNGLRRFLKALDYYIDQGVDPANEEGLRLLWHPSVYFQIAI